MISQSNILLISGPAQNTGKTALACSLIEYFAKSYDITGIKISHHFHPLSYDIPILLGKKEFVIYEEKERSMPKDSSRMLKAGANRVFFIISEKKYAGPAMKELLNILSPGAAIICESGGLADYYHAGLHLHLKNPHVTTNKPIRENVTEIDYDGSSFNLNFDKIVFEKNSWKLKKR